METHASWPLLTWLSVLISSEDVSVRYAVVFNGDTELGEEPEGTLEPHMESDGDVNATTGKLKHTVAKALSLETSLPVDIQTLRFETGKHKLLSRTELE